LFTNFLTDPSYNAPRGGNFRPVFSAWSVVALLAVVGGITIDLGGALRAPQVSVTMIFDASVFVILICCCLLFLIKPTESARARS
jgi:hypothetical protein